jgi:hypothetical protein
MYVSWANSLLCLADRRAGYGREEYSPSRQVSFEPEGRTVETILVKYEWRATLCSKGIIRYGTTYGRTHNLMLEKAGYGLQIRHIFFNSALSFSSRISSGIAARLLSKILGVPQNRDVDG